MASPALTAIRESFTVAANAQRVWEALHDSALVAECVPGVTLTAVKPDGLHEGTITVKFGPTKVEFQGEARVTYDESTQTCAIKSRGRDKRATSSGLAEANIQVVGGDVATVNVDGGFQVSGALGAFARTGGVYLARELMGEFAANLARRLKTDDAPSDQPAEPAAGRAEANTIHFNALLWRVIKSWFTRAFGRG